MAWKLRVALALACLAAVSGLIAWGRLGGDDSPPEGKIETAPALANGDCRQCHAEVWTEWESSLHAQSWTSPNVQAAFQHFGHDRQCESCHAPEPVASLAADRPVALRAENRESGVDCLSCHALSGGRVAAARTIVEAPCRPTATGLLTESRHCAACHTAIHKDWNESRYRAEGKACQSCHMGAVASRPGGKSHLCLGGHNDELVRSGVEMICRQEGEELVVSVTNHATGHNFPGERHNRVLLLQVVQRRADGEIALARQAMIKDITPFRGESSTEQIRVDETHTARFPVVDPPVAAEVQLLYKRFPWHADREALVVHRAEVMLE